MPNNKLAELLRKSGIDIDDDLLTSLQAAAKEDEKEQARLMAAQKETCYEATVQTACNGFWYLKESCKDNRLLPGTKIIHTMMINEEGDPECVAYLHAKGTKEAMYLTKEGSLTDRPQHLKRKKKAS